MLKTGLCGSETERADPDERQPARVMVKTRLGTRLVCLDDIRYVELVRRTARYHLSGGETIDSVTLRGSFREAVAPLLADPRFILCGASFAANLRHVTAVERGCFLLDGGGSLSLPRRFAARAKRAWAGYWLSGG